MRSSRRCGSSRRRYNAFRRGAGSDSGPAPFVGSSAFPNSSRSSKRMLRRLHCCAAPNSHLGAVLHAHSPAACSMCYGCGQNSGCPHDLWTTLWMSPTRPRRFTDGPRGFVGPMTDWPDFGQRLLPEIQSATEYYRVLTESSHGTSQRRAVKRWLCKTGRGQAVRSCRDRHDGQGVKDRRAERTGMPGGDRITGPSQPNRDRPATWTRPARGCRHDLPEGLHSRPSYFPLECVWKSDPVWMILTRTSC
jgi:hypothetical protein